MGREEDAGLSVEDAKRRLLEGTPTAADLKHDALADAADFVRRRPWTCVAGAVALGALAIASPRARRVALGAALFAARRLL